jgi:hypothetical protein
MVRQRATQRRRVQPARPAARQRLRAALSVLLLRVAAARTQDIRSLPMVITMAAMMPNGQDLLRVLPDPMGTLEKLSRVACPLLVRPGAVALSGHSDRLV